MLQPSNTRHCIMEEDTFYPLTVLNLKPIYHISKTGKLKSSRRPNGMATTIHSVTGYEMIGLHSVDGTARPHLVHRLVALQFIPNDDPENKIQVNHIDGNKLNNTVTNLEWISHLDNNIHASVSGIVNYVVNDEETVHQICALLEDYTTAEVAEKMNIPFTTITRIRDGYNWRHISKDYCFTDRRGQMLVTKDLVHDICFMLQHGWPVLQIADICGLHKDLIL